MARTASSIRHLATASQFRILTVICLMILTVGNLAIPARAWAGSNGQQISFDCSSMDYGVVKGTNQDGNFVTWGEQPAIAQNIFTAGWWWVGDATVYWHGPGGWKSKKFTVLKYSDSDVWKESC